MNSWGIRKLLLLVLAVQLSVLVLIALAALGLDVPLLRQLTGFVYLTFIPGLLMLRIFRLRDLSAIQTIVYSVALSIAFVMGSGLILNFWGPYFGISEPISTWPVAILLTIFVAMLSILAYSRDRHATNLETSTITIKNLLSPQYLFLILLPLLAVLGALLVNFYSNNKLLLVLMPIIVLIPIFVASNKFISAEAYPVAIIMIALALGYQYTLITPGLNGWDILQEYYLQNRVIVNSIWDPSVSHTINAMLSIVILCPVYSLVTGMESMLILKIIYPLIYSLVPLSLFEIYRQQVDEKRAFLAIFFFMSVFGFVTDLMSLPRQQIAELFFVALILLMVDRQLSHARQVPLTIIFVMALVLSHYGVAYISMAFFIIGWLLMVIMKKKKIQHLWNRLLHRIGNSTPDTPGASPYMEDSHSTSVLSGNLVAVFVVFILTWYMYTSSGLLFLHIVNIWRHIYDGIAEFFNPMAREVLVQTAIALDFASASPLGKFFRILQYLTQLFIIIGLLRLVLKLGSFRFRIEHIALTLVSALLLFAAIALPLFSSFFNLTRFYHLGLILLAPFGLLGAEAFFRWAIRTSRSLWLRLRAKRGVIPSLGTRPVQLLFVIIVIVPYFLFNTGFVFEIAGTEHVLREYPSSNALSPGKFDNPARNPQELAAAEWISHKPREQLLFSDYYGRMLLLGQVLYQSRHLSTPFETILTYLPYGSVVFIRTWNLEKGGLAIWEKILAQTNIVYKSIDAPPMRWIGRSDLIYTNGKAQMYIKR